MHQVDVASKRASPWLDWNWTWPTVRASNFNRWDQPHGHYSVHAPFLILGVDNPPISPAVSRPLARSGPNPATRIFLRETLRMGHALMNFCFCWRLLPEKSSCGMFGQCRMPVQVPNGASSAYKGQGAASVWKGVLDPASGMNTLGRVSSPVVALRNQARFRNVWPTATSRGR